MYKYFWQHTCIFKRGIARVIENNGQSPDLQARRTISVIFTPHYRLWLFKWIILLDSVLSSVRLEHNMWKCFSCSDMSNYLWPHGLWPTMGSSVHGILHARILEWVAIPFSSGSSLPREWTCVSCLAGRFFTVWATREAPYVCVYVSSSQSSLLKWDPSVCG